MGFSLQDWADITPPTKTVGSDTPSDTWAPVISGPDVQDDGSVQILNTLPGVLRVGSGVNYINLNPATPKIELFEASSLRLAIGELNGMYGYGASTFGFATGQYGTASKNWLTVEQTNGIRIGRNVTTLAQWDLSGNVFIGDQANEHVKVSSSGTQIYDGATLYATYGATTTIGLTASEHISISATAIQLKDGATVLTDISGGNVLIGQTGAGQSNVYITAGGVQLRNNVTAAITLDSSGDITMVGTLTGGVLESTNWAAAAGMQIDLDNATITIREADGLKIAAGADILFEHGGDIKFTSVTAPTACTGALAGSGAGNVDNGTHSYKITYANDAGETELGAVSNVVTVVDKAADGQVSLTGIPTSSSASVTKRKIYRTKAGGTDYYYVYQISNNTGTTYNDNIADASLGSVLYNSKLNDSFGQCYVDGKHIFHIYDSNAFVGYKAGGNDVTGRYNTYIGYYAFYTNIIGQRNIGLGQGAGYWETGSDKLYIDNAIRNNEADGRIKALIYGVMAAAAADQTLTINADTVVTYNLLVNGGDIGITADTDLIQLASGALTVNGYIKPLITDTDGTIEGQIWYDASEDKLKFKTAAGVETITSA